MSISKTSSKNSQLSLIFKSLKNNKEQMPSASQLNSELSKDFLFGVATSAYQNEGAWNEEGKGCSNWDYFTHLHGMENGDIACDDYHQVAQTIKLLKALGVNTYRFSIAWTRIQPNGVGKPNKLGLAYYQFLINELCNAGIEPMITLFHWDLPQALEAAGGWTNRATVDKFAIYAKILFEKFGSQVKYWITQNEPSVISTRGYGSATMAPGSNDPSLIPVVNHHLLLSHGLAVKAYRSLNLTGKIGISLNFQPVYCSAEGSQDEAIEADRIRNQIYLEPLLLGKSLASPNSSFVRLGDRELISQPMDFLGVNYYARKVISSTQYQPEKINSLGWETYPEGLYDVLT